MTCRIANVLKSHGVSKGDRVGIYLPMCPTAAAVMLACARIGNFNTEHDLFSYTDSGTFVYRGKLCRISRYRDKSKT